MTELVERLRQELVTKTMRKVLVSVVLGTMMYLVVERTGESQLWKIQLSVFIGGVTLVVQFLIAFEKRLARVEHGEVRHSARIEQMVEQSYTKINEATELFKLVEASALHTDTVRQLVRHATLIEPTAPPLVSRFAEAEIVRVSTFLRDLSEGGNVIYEGEDRDWMLALASHAESSIAATSLTSVDAGGRGLTDGGLWTSDLGQRYLEVQRDAVRRGVAIRRVFIMLEHLEPASDAGLTNVCRLQQAAGIDVRVLDWRSVPETLRDKLFDFVLFDETISYEVTAASQVDNTSRPTIINTRLELQTERVKTRIQRFKDLWESARLTV